MERRYMREHVWCDFGLSTSPTTLCIPYAYTVVNMHFPIPVAAFLGAAIAAPTVVSRSSTEPCALVSKALANNETRIDADIAYQCLQSVPLDAEGAVLQIEGVKTMAQFQSTLAYLKDPPQGYLYPAVDIMAALDQILAKVKNNDYLGEYDFQMDVRNVIDSAYDGHFNYAADITSTFVFIRELPIHSISSDGLTLPEIYLGNDTFLLQASDNATLVSPVATINGRDVEAWLNDYAALTGDAYQDPDANYNDLFPTISPITLVGGSFQYATRYQGNHTDVTFRNCTTRTLKHQAFTQANFTGVKDGATFFNTFCTEDGKTATLAIQPAAPESTTTPATRLPFKPLPTPSVIFPEYVVSDNLSIWGYFPENNKDLAVLRLKSFSPTDNVEFANAVRVFFATAQASGRTKLMIDLRGNGGGHVVLGYDLFAQLFPNLYPYGATNLRTFPLMDDVGEVVTELYSNITNATATLDQCSTLTFANSPFNARELYDEENHAFTSWKGYNGPNQHHNDNFTNLSRYNLDDKYQLNCDNVSNHRNLVGVTPQVFQPEDIVLVQDGECLSTCAIFGEFMKTQANVSQVVLGGRKQLGPMQGIGGVKGAQAYTWEELQAGIAEAFEQDATPTQQKHLAKVYDYEAFINTTTQAINRAAPNGDEGKLARVNLRNNIRREDETVTPLQFVYEAADCRLFYTAPMISDQSEIWKAAYNSHWGSAGCVQGSTGHPSSKQGNAHASPPANARQNNTVFPSGLSSYRNAKSVDESN